MTLNPKGVDVTWLAPGDTSPEVRGHILGGAPNAHTPRWRTVVDSARSICDSGSFGFDGMDGPVSGGLLEGVKAEQGDALLFFNINEEGARPLMSPRPRT